MVKVNETPCPEELPLDRRSFADEEPEGAPGIQTFVHLRESLREPRATAERLRLSSRRGRRCGRRRVRLR